MNNDQGQALQDQDRQDQVVRDEDRQGQAVHDDEQVEDGQDQDVRDQEQGDQEQGAEGRDLDEIIYGPVDEDRDQGQDLHQQATNSRERYRSTRVRNRYTILVAFMSHRSILGLYFRK